jgi:tricarballylate dehydrogenase
VSGSVQERDVGPPGTAHTNEYKVRDGVLSMANVEFADHADVLVVGAGNAALSAALSAAEAGASVIVLEKAPKSLRGGNTYFTGDLRFPWATAEDLFPLIGDVSEAEAEGMRAHARPYPPASFYADIMNVTDGMADTEVLETLVANAYDTMRWMAEKGHRWVASYANPSASHALRLNGGGAALSDRWFEIAEAAGVDIRYEHSAVELIQSQNGSVSGVRVLGPGGFANYSAGAVVLAAGGFEANAAMRAAYLGPGWDTVKVRGCPFNTGDGLAMAMNVGAMPYGQWSGCHASPQDFSLPPFANRAGVSPTEFRRHEYPWCIMVNRHGERFIDEGADLRSLTYARVGREIMRQPGGVAFQIFDRKAEELVAGAGFSYQNATSATADTLEGLAKALEIDVDGFLRTVAEYNAAIQPGEFNPARLDGKHTHGLTIPKSNWAQTVDQGPFSGYATVCGITFTFGGLRVDRKARVIHSSGQPIRGLYAAGEIVGGLFFNNYAGGTGMMQGAVFGRIAGAEGARLAAAATS